VSGGVESEQEQLAGIERIIIVINSLRMRMLGQQQRKSNVTHVMKVMALEGGLMVEPNNSEKLKSFIFIIILLKLAQINSLHEGY
jgi:hypothetical protein